MNVSRLAGRAAGALFAAAVGLAASTAQAQDIRMYAFSSGALTLGGVDTDELSSSTMQSRRVPGLYFIGEVVDVTGWLGGYNFQWAWASGHAAGNAV